MEEAKRPRGRAGDRNDKNKKTYKENKVDDLTSARSLARSSWPALATSLVGEALSLFGRLQNLERTHECVINTHHCARIVEFTTVIRCREERYQLPLRKELVAVFDYLMSSTNK